MKNNPQSKKLRRNIPLGRLFFSDQNKYVWCSNPKCASTTIRQLIAQSENPSLQNLRDKDVRVQGSGILDHLAVRKISREYEKIDSILTSDEYFRFVFSRNPYLRIVSAYENKVKRSIANSKPKNQKPKIEVLDWLGRNIDDVDQEITFDEFVDYVTSADLTKLNPHWKPQTLVVGTEIIDYSFVGKLESFHEDISYCMSKIGYSLERYQGILPERKKTQYNSSYKKHLLRNKDKLVRCFYDDFEYFTYNYNLIPDC